MCRGPALADRLARLHNPSGLSVLPPRSHNGGDRQLGGRRLFFLALRGVSSDWRSLVMCARPPTLMVQRGGTGTKR